MNIECTVMIEYDKPEKARIIYRSTRIDDGGFVESKVDGGRIIASIRSRSVSSLLHTLDDYLSCVSVAESIADKN
ncbi:MAG: KEOPS complex subunit Pcc1 [Candidatus Thermoplasmatota archaeon]